MKYILALKYLGHYKFVATLELFKTIILKSQLRNSLL